MHTSVTLVTTDSGSTDSAVTVVTTATALSDAFAATLMCISLPQHFHFHFCYSDVLIFAVTILSTSVSD